MPSNSKPSSPVSSQIKNIYIPVYNYKFDHGPSHRDKTNSYFTGREDAKKRIRLIFAESKSKHGAYLVTGYRGMGKTSLVREAFNEKVIDKNGNKKQFHEICQKGVHLFYFSLSQDEVTDMDLLRQIGAKVNQYARENIIEGFQAVKAKISRIALSIGLVGGILLALIPFILNIFYVLNDFEPENDRYYIGDVGTGVLYFGMVAILHIGIKSLVRAFLEREIVKWNRTYEARQKLAVKVDHFEKRLFSSITQEDRDTGGIDLDDSNPGRFIANKIFSPDSDNSDKKNTLNFEKASTKEIEAQLQNILSDIEKIREEEASPKSHKDQPSHHLPEELLRFINGKFKANIPNFIFVVDELDKIEPDYFFSKGDREQISEDYYSMEMYHITTKARQRQEAISKLLANLKNFLSDSDAKFIFIGGRDMFDASLADIADRESFYSSIFNEVIYVSSFFKDKQSSHAGISQLTEIFIGQFLTPTSLEGTAEGEAPGAGSSPRNILADYVNNLLDWSAFKEDEKLANAYRFKILHLLQNFVIFLTYRSNGSPKKLIELWERYLEEDETVMVNCNKEGDRFNEFNQVVKIVYPNDANEPAKEDIKEVLKKEKERGLTFYLRFSFYDQYEINLTSNFYRPYTIINSKHLKRLGDKLLYSSAFLMDHILKFHKSAFSWRNLELLPDVILANKDPNFRQYFQEIMHFLSSQHIRETLNAIFQYKFYSEVRVELEYLSKVSEFSSAAFNFTLDESFHLKNYYKKKLAAKYLEYRYVTEGRHEVYINSIGYLHSVIGDLHYYDEEYDDAIIHYTDSVQTIRQALEGTQPVLSHKFLLFNINQLNLGHCLERTRAYNRAYSVFRTLIIQTSRLKLLNEIDREKISQNQEDGALNSKRRGRTKKGKTDHDSNDGWESPYKRMQLFMKPHVALLGVIEKQRIDGITYDNLERNIFEYAQFVGLEHMGLFPSQRNEILVYDKINEKQSLSRSSKGIDSYSSLNAQHLNKHNPQSDKKRIVTMVTDYYVSVGSILFFKNQIFYRLLYKRNGGLANEAISRSIVNFYKSKENQDKKSKYRPSQAAYLYYLHALFNFNVPYVENFHTIAFGDVPEMGEKKEGSDHTSLTGKFNYNHETKELEKNIFDNLKFVLFFLEPGSYSILNSSQCETLGNILSKLADATLACVNTKPKNLDIVKIANVNEFDIFENDLAAAIKQVEDVLSNDDNHQIGIELPIIICRLAYEFFKAGGNTYSSSFQLKKVLFIIRNVVAEYRKLGVVDDALESHLESIGATLLKNMVKTTTGSNRAQITKYRQKLDDMDRTEFTFEIYQGLSTSPDVKEVIYVIEYIKLKLGLKTELPSANGTFNVVSSMFARVFELKFKSEYNLNELNGFYAATKKDEHFKDNYETILSYIADGMFCNRELIKILNTFGINYILTHSYKASVHYSMGKLCDMLNDLKDWYKEFGGADYTDPDTKIKTFLGREFELETDRFYHYELVGIHLDKAIDLHSEGHVYKSVNRDMYVLDDDFNDPLIHFCAASERLRINLGSVQVIKEKAAGKIKESYLYKYKKYLP